MGPRPLVSITIIKIHTAHSPQSMHGYRHVHASYWLQIALHGQRSDRHRTKRPGGLFGVRTCVSRVPGRVGDSVLASRSPGLLHTWQRERRMIGSPTCARDSNYTKYGITAQRHLCRAQTFLSFDCQNSELLACPGLLGRGCSCSSFFLLSSVECCVPCGHDSFEFCWHV